MDYKRMPIELESPEQIGYHNVRYNLAESSVRDITFNTDSITIHNLILCYGDHLGKQELRTLISQETNNISVNNILLTPSAATALFIIATSLLNPEDHLIVISPNYATNIETPRAIGCEISIIKTYFEEGFTIDRNQIIAQIKSNTKLISVTHPHNPSGSCLQASDYQVIQSIIKKYGCYVLVDETYRELQYQEKLPYGADIDSHIISVASMSKAYGTPGIRIGRILTQDPVLFESFLAAKEQIIICNSVIDEEIAYIIYKNKQKHLEPIMQKNIQNFHTLKEWMGNNPYMERVEPQGGVVCFPKIKDNLNIDYDRFYSDLNTIFGTYVGPGHRFEMGKNFMRIGYGYPSNEELVIGLDNITKALELQLNK